jgi:hypothetical protein
VQATSEIAARPDQCVRFRISIERSDNTIDADYKKFAAGVAQMTLQAQNDKKYGRRLFWLV